jgi:hypothetical protein
MRMLLCAIALLAACGGGTAGMKAFGEDCMADGDCASGACREFQMMTVKKCTKSCTVATQANDCPNPPSQGTCNNQGFCRF